MTKRIYATLILLAALVPAGSIGASARHDGLYQQDQPHAAPRSHRRALNARQRAKARRHNRRRAVAYVCPMHSDIRERSRGTCPKCLMELVPEPRGAKVGGM